MKVTLCLCQLFDQWLVVLYSLVNTRTTKSTKATQSVLVAVQDPSPWTPTLIIIFSWQRSIEDKTSTIICERIS